MIPLIRATHDNGVFEALESEWREQLVKFDEDPGEYVVPYMDHARKISAEVPVDGKYGIYVLRNEEPDKHGEHIGFAHFNVAFLPKTKGKTLRVNWLLFSPMYDFENVSEQAMYLAVGSLVFGAMRMTQDEMKADHVKLRLRNSAERQFSLAFASALEGFDTPVRVAVRGNWLHIEDIPNGVGA